MSIALTRDVTCAIVRHVISKTTPTETLGERVRSLRKRRGLSHDKLAELVGTSRRHLIRIEQGTRPKPDMLNRIAEALGTDADHLTAGISDGRQESEDDDLALALLSPIRAIVARAVEERFEQVTTARVKAA